MSKYKQFTKFMDLLSDVDKEDFRNHIDNALSYGYTDNDVRIEQNPNGKLVLKRVDK